MSRPHAFDIAIVGMAATFPGAPDLRSYWRNIVTGTDAITEVPSGRWHPSFFERDGDGIDRIPCRRGGFVDDFAEIDPLQWGMMPATIEGINPDQLMALELSRQALEDAGATEELPRERTEVVLGRGGYVSPGQIRLLQAVRSAWELGESVRRIAPSLSDEVVERVREEYRSRVQHIDANAMLGLVPNLAASRIANRLDLRGPAYTIDAACASALIAVERACVDLASGVCDLALAGGVHVAQDLTFWVVFDLLGALSGQEEIRPFDRRADGLLIGEGAGLVVLKRLEEAIRDEDRIYATIRGAGIASDGRGTSLLNPRAGSQVLAIERAWKAAGIDPRSPGSIGLIEAHGTATPVGDRTELETIARVFGPPNGRPRPVLGSVKSMIGHTMPAAGIAGMIKAALAIHHGVLPPTLHCDDPLPEMEGTRFRTISDSEPWEEGSEPFRAGVNAFGFGGINAHVILESSEELSPKALRVRSGPPEDVVLLAAESRGELGKRLEEGPWTFDGGPCRLALLAPTRERIERAREIVTRGRAFHDWDSGLFFSPEGLIASGLGLAFLYPGVEDVAGDVSDLFGRSPTGAVNGEEDRGENTAWLNRVRRQRLRESKELTEVLEKDLGLCPDAVAGHSIGEWSAMHAAGMIPWEAVDDLVAIVDPESLELPDVGYLMVGLGADRVRPVIEGMEDVHVALDNCPHQSVLCGPDAGLDSARERLTNAGALTKRFRFRSGFHSPHLGEEFLELARDVVARIPLGTPARRLWSATSVTPFPSRPDAVRRLMIDHLVRPIRFRELVRRLHDDGVGVFVQVGEGSLAGFVRDTLRGERHRAFGVGSSGEETEEEFRRLAASLWVEGENVLLRRLLRPLPGPSSWSRRSVPLSMDAPVVALEKPLPIDASIEMGSPTGSGKDQDPVLEEFHRVGELLRRTQQEVAELWSERSAAREDVQEPRRRKRSTTISIDRCPWLLDHRFYSLPPDWPDPSDGYPVVPLTMSLEMMLEAARELAPERRVVGVEDVRALQWLSCEDPVEIEIDAEFVGPDRIRVAIGEYAVGTVVVSREALSPRPGRALRLEGRERPAGITPEEAYERRMLFHGPRYRSLTGLHAISSDGIRGEITRLEAPGSLLDGAGQLLGLWIRLGADGLPTAGAMPVSIDRLAFYGPEARPGDRFECVVRVHHSGKRRSRADMEISRAGRLWGRIDGWVDQKMFTSDQLLWSVERPEKELMADPVPGVPGAHWLQEPFGQSATRDHFARWYLTRTERKEYSELPLRRQDEWLRGRIVMKDSARRALMERGRDGVWPIEMEIAPGSEGAARIRTRHGQDLRGSIAHEGDTAVAIVARGEDVGIDLVKLEPGDEGSELSPEERHLLADLDGNTDAWRPRFRAAKGAMAKRDGASPRGAPGEYSVEGVEAERMIVNGIPVETRNLGGRVIAWTPIATATDR